jgi:vacuolar protein sorting-associated protein 72
MSALLDAEADDELALLFEEVEDDNEFSVAAGEDGGEEDDMGLDSSSDDDDDQGPNVRPDDFEGETQIQKDEKAEKKKRRAQQDLRFKIASKKVKIDPTTVTAVPAPRPKKKSERISWIPTPEEGPTRSSSRRQTMQNKELTHARLKDSEEKRIRLIATMEEAAKRKAHLKPKEMTQAERLAEAERVERHNSKSLNRWEEMEKRKAEERKAKIEALQNRRLEGPVMSYWSGIATWTDGRLTRLGKVDVTAKPEKEDNTRKKSKKLDKDGKATTEQKITDNSTPVDAMAQPVPQTTSESATGPVVPAEGDAPKEKQDAPTIEKTDAAPVQERGAKPESTTDNATDASTASTPPIAQPVKSPADDTQGAETAVDTGTPKGSTEPPEMTPEGKNTEEAPEDEQASENRVEGKSEETPKDPAPDTQDMQISSDVSTPKLEEQGNQNQSPSEGNADTIMKEPDAESTTAQPTSEIAIAPQAVSPTAIPDAAIVSAPPDQQGETAAATQQEQVAPESQTDQPATTSEEMPQPEVPQHLPVIEQTGRTLTVLENFDDKTAQSREFSIYFNAKKPPRLTSM